MKNIQIPSDMMEALSATNDFIIYFQIAFNRVMGLQFSHLLFGLPAFRSRVINAPLRDNGKVPFLEGLCKHF